MKNKTFKVSAEFIVFAITFILACFTTNSDRLGGYWGSGGNVIIFTRYILIFAFVFLASLINSKNDKALSKFLPISSWIIAALVIFDYYVTQFSGSQFLFRVWWIGAIFVAQAAVFLAITIKPNDNYKTFFKAFWIGFAPIYFFLLFLCFARAPFSSDLSVNLKLGQGTFIMLKEFINNFNVSFEAPLIAFGNFLIFIPLPFFIYSFSKKSKSWLICLIGFLVPIIIEGYQYFFKCGNVDIDDLVLNWGGFIIGFIIFNIIKKKHLTD